MYNSTSDKDKIASISIRDVNINVWRDFKKLACIYDMSIQEYLKFIVEKEMAKIEIKRK